MKGNEMLELKHKHILLSTPEMYLVIAKNHNKGSDNAPWEEWDKPGVWFMLVGSDEEHGMGWLKVCGFTKERETLGVAVFPIHVVIAMRQAFLDKAIIVNVNGIPYRYVHGVVVELVNEKVEG